MTALIASSNLIYIHIVSRKVSFQHHDETLLWMKTFNEKSLQVERNSSNHEESERDPNHVHPMEHESSTFEHIAKKIDTIDNNIFTIAYRHGPFGGFRNQFMTFGGIMLGMKQQNFSQVIVQSIKWKDLFGTNQRLRHDLFFDVKHWNSFYPQLPRFIEYNKSLYPDVNIYGKSNTPSLKWNVNDLSKAKNPYAFGDTGLQAQNRYKEYVKRVTNGLQTRSPVDLLMLRGAFRPHPDLQLIINNFIRSNRLDDGFIALHARIEPDMQKHEKCISKKVTNFTKIIQSIEAKFPEPPMKNVLLIMNRGILEEEVSNPKAINPLASYNLEVLNNILKVGLWDGRVPVIDAGIELAKTSGHEIYSTYYSLSGSIIDFFLAVESHLFIGTEVSSFSVDVEATRYFRSKMSNYHYLQDGLVLSTPEGAQNPPRFQC